MYASLCDFVYIALFLPFVLGFCLSFLFFFFLLLYNFFLVFFLFFILITLFYFFLSFFLSFFLPFLLSHEADMFFVLQPGVSPVPLSGESRIQDIGPTETSQLHVISNIKSSPRDLQLNAKTQLHSTTSKLQCWTTYAKQLARQEYNPTH